MTLTKQSLTSLFATLVAGSFAGLSLAACDLTNKDIGKETNGDDGNDDGDDDGGEVCEPGDTKPADDGCNTCTCDDNGDWACTEIACGDDDGGGPGDDGGTCEPGDTMPAPDGCNTCTCDDNGDWACTLLGCEESGDDGGTCEPGDTMPAGDGCNTCSCDDEGNWACTEIACETLPLCGDNFMTDDFALLDAAVDGDILAVTVAYSGGCLEHTFELCWDGEWLESSPVQTGLRISHTDPGDPCDAFPSEDLEFTLVPLQTSYIASYGEGSADLLINLEAWTESLLYEF